MHLLRFQYIKCQLTALKNTHPTAIHHALDDLPDSLDETYNRILKGIPRGKQEYAQRLFQCVAVSIRPLRVEELAYISAIQFDAEPLPHYNTTWRPKDPEEEVLSVCSSLITIIDMNGSRVVRFSHSSVKEYLTSLHLAKAEERLSRYHILSDSAHITLAEASLSVLLALDGQVDKDIMKDFPLAIYAARYWVDHVRHHDVPSRVKDAMKCLFDPDKPNFATWLWIHDIDRSFRETMFTARPSPPEVVPLYYATRCGLPDLVDHLLVTRPQDLDARGGCYSTSLHAAVAKGNVDIVRLLLEHGADVAALNDEGRNPLLEASHRGNLDVIGLLLNHRADINSQTPKGRTPLMAVSGEGELEAARVFLQHGAVVDSCDNDGWTSLMFASQNGHVEVVHLLHQNGANVDSCSNHGRTSLMLASRNGHLEITLLLLQNSTTVDSRYEDGCTSLRFASEHGHLEVVHLLLQNGATVDSRDNDGQTSLMTASENGHLEVVRLLLQNVAAVGSRDDNGCTSLMFASGNGHLEVVHLLLQNGATVDSRDNNGRTSLMTASQNGHLEVVRLLLQNGAAPDSPHIDNRSPSSGM
jgi:ankyrin repeat protein